MSWKNLVNRKRILVGIAIILAIAGSSGIINYVANREIPTSVIIAEGDIGIGTNVLEEEYLNKNTVELLYESLEDEQMKNLYVTVRDCLLNFKSSAEIPSATRADINNVLYAVLGDHPEIFWLSGYEYNLGIFSPIYSVTEGQKAELERELRIRSASLIDEAVYVDGLNDFEKARMIYDYIIKNTSYGESERDQEIDSVILEQKSVCSGYAKAFAYLMDRLHIPCACINSSTHMYNVVELEGVRYLVDVTSGDGFEVAELGNFPDYSYFMCSNEELRNSEAHQPIEICELLQYSCMDTGKNYYTEYGVFVSQWNREYLTTMEETLSFAEISSIKCAEEETYETALSDIKEYFTEENLHIVPNYTLKTITVLRF